jgi:hypothetical protein
MASEEEISKSKIYDDKNERIFKDVMHKTPSFPATLCGILCGMFFCLAGAQAADIHYREPLKP